MQEQLNYPVNTKRKTTILFISALIGVLGAVWSIFVIGFQSAYKWSFAQKEYWISALELTIWFIALTFIILFFKRNRERLAVSFLLLCVFSFLHAFFFVLLAMCLYAAMIVMTGHLLCRLLCKDHKQNLSTCIFLGLVGMIVLVAICSVLKIGTPERLRIVYLAVFLVETFFCRAQIKQLATRIFCDNDENRFFADRGPNALLKAVVISAIVTAVLVQMGRACIALDYDSVWYGLRSEVMLAPFTGIYDKVIATGVAYSYTKGSEVLALAFNFSFTESFVYGVNLMLAVMVLYVIYAIVSLLCSKKLALIVTLCCSVTPGIMNMAVTAKSDIATLLTQLLVFYFAVKAMQEKRGDLLTLCLSAALFSFCFKPTAFVFTLVLLLPVIFLAICFKIRMRLKDLTIVILPLIALLALTARTFMLTGLPFSSFGTGVLQSLGFSYRFPYAEPFSDYVVPLSDFLFGGVLLKRLPRLYQFFFAPLGETMDHVIIAWGGVLFSVCWILLVVRVCSNPKHTWKKVRENGAYALSLLSIVMISAVSLATLLLLAKPDGNYYMLMYALTFIHCAVEAKDLSSQTIKKGSCALTPLIACGLALCLLTSWSWTLGLTPIELNNKGFYHHKERNQIVYEQTGLGEISRKLESEGGKSRVMVMSDEIPWLLSLPAMAESWLDVCYWGNREISQSDQMLYDYYQITNTQYLLVEKEYVESGANPNMTQRLVYLASRGYVRTDMESDQYLLLRFDASGMVMDTALCEYLFPLQNNSTN